MIRHLHPTDSPGLLQFSQSSGQGETCTLAGALSGAIQGGLGGFPTVKYAGIALSPRAWQSCWVEARRGRINGVLRAGPRSGPQAWEVGELYLRNSKSELALDLLEQIAVPAGGAGAHRIFARVPANSAVYDDARKAGYSTVHRESVFRADSATDAITKLGIPDHSLQLRQRDKSDDAALFRMHNLNTPIEVRMKLGQTLQDWVAGSERLGRKPSEWVYDLATGEIGGLVQRKSTRSGLMFNLNWAAEAGSELPGLVAAALAASKDIPVSVAVPEYRPALSHLLVTLGFAEQAQYEVMVKPLAQTVTEAQKAFAAIN
ncbi:hypothetical protein [Candidatus Lucifugimonas marina]|uniref:Uncharacterized protein n=1 Tax=Candidatus Lucifugimonas marina TaxID=3038979 RepID=A0AAJ5ZHH1_9CHLR|nr:hypothetical protein [SAR202 cluster bacterium JH639]WFG36208.1 hypothetical protein GKN94_11060 [SAR202 cluster bacterium JH545]WFG40154.1 hypothetical protein GKO48_11165 [SAR202 cluster bacterium JH1073]